MSPPKLASVFLLLLAFSVQIHGRQFFSKIPSVNNNIPKETTNPNTEEEKPESTFLPENQKQEQFPNYNSQDQPNFLPQSQTGYGLYGHESGLNAPETTTTTNNKVTYAPYVTPITSGSFVDLPNSNNNAYEAEQNENNNYYSNNGAYEAEQRQNVGVGARFVGNNDGYKTTVANNNHNSDGYKTTAANNDRYNSDGYRNVATKDYGYDNSDGYRKTVGNEGRNYYNGNGYGNNVERQGMSDTRFLENGKYFYDVKNEENYLANRNQFRNNRVPLRNEYTYATNGAAYYGNGNVNSYNRMNGHENKEDFEFEP